MAVQVSPANPQPRSPSIAPAVVYTTVSMSGLTCRPWNTVSSPVLTMAVTSVASTISSSPRRNRAAPTPPAMATITEATICEAVE